MKVNYQIREIQIKIVFPKIHASIAILAIIKQSKKLPPLKSILSLKLNISGQIYFVFYSGNKTQIVILSQKLQKIRLLVLAYC